MTGRKCFEKHFSSIHGICAAERFVLFHDTRFRIAVVVYEFSCDKCNKSRRIYFISR